LDVLRLAVLHPEAATFFASTDTFPILLNFLATETDTPYANQMMALRFLANSFRWEATRTIVIASFDEVLSVVQPIFTSSNWSQKNVRVALYTILLNYGVFFASENSHKLKKKSLFPLLMEGLKTEKDEEGQIRLIICLGTVTVGEEDYKRELLTSFQPIFQSFVPASDKVREVAAELVLLWTNKLPPRATPTATTPPVQSATPQLPNMSNFGMGGGGSGGIGGSGGSGDLPFGLSPQFLSQLASSPELMAALANPTLMTKLQAIMQDPSKMAMYQNDPEVMAMVQKLAQLMNR